MPTYKVKSPIMTHSKKDKEGKVVLEPGDSITLDEKTAISLKSSLILSKEQARSLDEAEAKYAAEAAKKLEDAKKAAAGEEEQPKGKK